MAANLAIDNFWVDKDLYCNAERSYYENLAKLLSVSKANPVVNGETPSGRKKRKHPVSRESMEQVAASKGCPAFKNDDLKAGNKIDPQPAVVKLTKAEKREKKRLENAVQEQLPAGGGPKVEKSTLANQVKMAREHIKTSLKYVDNLVPQVAANKGPSPDPNMLKILTSIENSMKSLEKRVTALEIKCATCSTPTPVQAPQPTPPAKAATPQKPAVKAATPQKPAADDDDDVDLFGSGSEDDDNEAQKLKEQRLAEYAAKKSKKPALIAKSSIILDVKPWDDETDMKAMESAVRAIEMDGLLWGASKLVPLAYGIKKLQITCVVEDDKVSVDLLQELIENNDSLVQSVDIAAFNKI